jgi:hypothetical protein
VKDHWKPWVHVFGAIWLGDSIFSKLYKN